MANKKGWLCKSEDITEDKCKEFTITKHGREVDIFILKRDNCLYAYKNNCPHTGASLNWKPGVFMDYDDLYIQCTIHGARFEVETGLCVWGPCVNQFLMKVEIMVIDNYIYLKKI